ncbi:hypothetical protein ACOMHN_061076 [Nucella lapillus]
MDDSSTAPYPGFDKSGQYSTPRKALRIRPEGSEFASRNNGSINLFSDEKNKHVVGPLPSPRCLTYEARQNYERNRNGQVSGLLGGGTTPGEDSTPVARIKPEAQTIANYHRGGNMSRLISNNNNAQGPQSARQAPTRVKAEAADNAALDKGRRMNALLHDPCALPSTPKPAPRVKVEAGENAELGLGTQMAEVMFEYGRTPRNSGKPPPRVKTEASENASLDHGGRMQTLFSNYGKQPQSSRPAPRVRDGGHDMAALDQGRRLARLMHEGDRLPGDSKPPPRATSSAGRRNTKKGKKSSISQVFSETSKWQIVPTPGLRKAKV